MYAQTLLWRPRRCRKRDIRDCALCSTRREWLCLGPLWLQIHTDSEQFLDQCLLCVIYTRIWCLQYRIKITKAAISLTQMFVKNAWITQRIELIHVMCTKRCFLVTPGKADRWLPLLYCLVRVHLQNQVFFWVKPIFAKQRTSQIIFCRYRQ